MNMYILRIITSQPPRPKSTVCYTSQTLDEISAKLQEYILYLHEGDEKTKDGKETDWFENIFYEEHLVSLIALHQEKQALLRSYSEEEKQNRSYYTEDPIVLLTTERSRFELELATCLPDA